MENIDIDIDKDDLKNIDIDMAILENIDIDKGILQNIVIDKILYRLGFGISNTPNYEFSNKPLKHYESGVETQKIEEVINNT